MNIQGRFLVIFRIIFRENVFHLSHDLLSLITNLSLRGCVFAYEYLPVEEVLHYFSQFNLVNFDQDEHF